VGGAASTHLEDEIVNNPAVLAVPAGISVGWRRPIGKTRGVSVYAAPFYQWTRLDSGVVESVNSFAGSAGVDFALSPSVGVTLGAEVGSSNGSERSSASFGAAVGFAPGRK
jgi:hypothetical protein